MTLTLPASLEMERAVLAAAMKAPAAVLAVCTSLKRGDFYFEPHRRLFDAVETLWQAGHDVTLSAVGEELRKRSSLEYVGGEAGLVDLYRCIPTTAHVDYHIGELRALALRRDGITAASDIMARLYDTAEPTMPIMADALGLWASLLERRRGKDGFKAARDLAPPWYDNVLDRRSKRPDELLVVTFGIPTWDRKRQWEPGEVVIVGARTSVGKSLLALAVAAHNAVDCGRPTAIITLEMSERQVINRLIANLGRVNQNRIYARDVTELEAAAVLNGLNRFTAAPLWISHCAGNTAPEITGRVKLLKQQHPDLRLVVLDYIQLVDTTTAMSIRERVTEVSHAVKRAAGENEVTILMLSQLSRDVEKRGGKPRLSDLRESGDLEQDADGVLMIAASSEPELEPPLIRLWTSWEKDRNGLMAGTEIELRMDRLTCRIDELYDEHPALPPERTPF